MKIIVKVKPKTKVEKVERKADGSFEVLVKEPAREGKANEAAREALAAFFKVPKSSICLIGGAKSRNKIFEIN